MPKCPVCSAEYTSGQLFCSECGTRLPLEDVKDNAPAPVYEPEPVQKPAEPSAPVYPENAAPAAQQPVRYSAGSYASTPAPQYDAPAAPKPQYDAQPAAPAAVPAAPVRQQYDAPQYAASPVPAPKQENAPEKGSPYAPVSTGAFYGSMFLLAIPVVGLIFAIVWACGGCKKKNLRNFALAHILYGLTVTLLGVLSTVLIWFACKNAIVNFLGDLGYVIVDGSGQVITTDGSESSGGTSSTAAPSPAPNTPASLSGNAMEQLQQLTSGSYVIRYQIDMMGFTIEGMEAQSGSKFVSEMRIPSLISSCSLQDGSVFYKYDSDRGVYCVTSIKPDKIFDMSDFGTTVVGTGTTEFNGRQLPYECYETSYNESLYVFLDNGTPCGLRSVSDDDDLGDIIITEFSAAPSAELFQIPAGLQEISEEQFDEEAFGF